MHFTSFRIFALGSVVVKTQTCLARMKGFLTIAMYERNNIIKYTHYDETKQKAHDLQIVRAKGNLKLSYDGSRQKQKSGTNQPKLNFRAVLTKLRAIQEETIYSGKP